MNLFEVPKNTAYNIGDRVWYFSPVIGEMREYVISKIYTNYRNTRQIAYKLTVYNQNVRFWAVVLEKNLLNKKGTV